MTSNTTTDIQMQSWTPAFADQWEVVQSGEIQFQLDGKTLVATPGTFIYSPKEQRHLFANISDQPAKMLCWMTPAGLEQFFMEIGTPADDPTAPPPCHRSGYSKDDRPGSPIRSDNSSSRLRYQLNSALEQRTRLP